MRVGHCRLLLPAPDEVTVAADGECSVQSTAHRFLIVAHNASVAVFASYHASFIFELSQYISLLLLLLSVAYSRQAWISTLGPGSEDPLTPRHSVCSPC